ncbi:MAG: DUF2905 domain-containing protein [Candidatus Omnitrophota bacterium]|nr:DUF2905 domain-containing protein [Candidatus Omnitrophota bacterium]
MGSLGKILMLFGAIIFLVGGLFVIGGKVPWLGRLPGDIYVQKNNFTFFLPITTSIVISISLSLLLILFKRKW